MTDLFDLQRFAEEDGGDVPADAGSNPDADDTSPAEEGEVKDTESSAEGAKNDTILGGKSTPNVPDAYDFKSIVPEGMTYDEQSAAAFGDVAKKAGLSQEQAAAIASYGMQYMQQGVDAAMKAVQDTQAGWAEDARTQLGGEFDATVAKAAAARDVLAAKVPGFTAMLNETGAGNRIEMIRFMAAIGDLIGEDGGLRGAQAGAEKSIYPNTDFKKYS
nr:MAG TPA: putative protease [Caudoviricetes sp.]